MQFSQYYLFIYHNEPHSHICTPLTCMVLFVIEYRSSKKPFIPRTKYSEDVGTGVFYQAENDRAKKDGSVQPAYLIFASLSNKILGSFN